MEANSVIFGLLSLVLLAVFYLKRRYEYWSSQGVYQFKPIWMLGNMKPILSGEQSFGQLVTGWYRELRSKGRRFGGGYFFTKPVLVVTEPELVKQICTTDFQNFNSHAAFVSEETDPLSGHLFNLEGAKWKTMRSKLTPTFTSGKMKMMFNTIQACTDGFKNMLNESIETKQPVDIKDILGRFTTDVIGSCAFGIDCNSVKDPDTEFRVYGKKVFDTGTASVWKALVFLALPQFLLKLINAKVTPRDVESFFLNVVKDTVNYREKNNIVRKDFMHLMIQLKNKGKLTDNDDILSNGDVRESALNINELSAQAFVFFLAGFETSSTTMTFALYELAVNQKIQATLREEINSVLKKYDGKVTYESVMEMHYLDRVVNETLRRHPPVISLPRACTADYRIPGTDVKIGKGTFVQIPVLGLHMDPVYYPDPEKFDPDRFTEENKAKRPAYTFIPFGEGPRICIGLRFGVLQSKLGLISLLRNYRITVNKKTRSPLELDPDSSINTVKGGVWVNVSRV